MFKYNRRKLRIEVTRDDRMLFHKRHIVSYNLMCLNGHNRMSFQQLYILLRLKYNERTNGHTVCAN